MAYVKVTDGGVIRFFDTNNPRSRAVYNELVKHNTGFDTVVNDDGTPKEFSEEQVKETIEKAIEANGKRKTKTVVSSSRAVKDED